MGSASQSRGVVLIVEDETAIADILRMYLSRAGFGVHIATDGRSGPAEACKLLPAAIDCAARKNIHDARVDLRTAVRDGARARRALAAL